MELRQANADDAQEIKAVARESLLATYDFLGEATIRDAIEGWYGDPEAFSDHIADGNDQFLAIAGGPDDAAVAAFSQSALVEEDDETVGEIRWLHVHPDHRGHGHADALLDRTEEMLRRQGATCLRGVVLAENREGNEFWEAQGLERAGIREVNIGGTVYAENVYETEEADGGPRLEAGEATTPDGRTVQVAFDEGQTGSQAPFYPVYTEEGELYGWYCGNCDGFEVAMDAMERLECNDCTNMRKASRWDSAYL